MSMDDMVVLTVFRAGQKLEIARLPMGAALSQIAPDAPVLSDRPVMLRASGKRLGNRAKRCRNSRHSPEEEE